LRDPNWPIINMVKANVDIKYMVMCIYGKIKAIKQKENVKMQL